MKKTVFIFAVFLFLIVSCVKFPKSSSNEENSYDDSFTEKLNFPFNADYQQIQIFSPEQWNLWCRTENKLYHDFSSKDEIFSVEYKASDDFSISINHEMKVSEGETYLIASNIFLPKRNISANFILYDRNDNYAFYGGLVTYSGQNNSANKAFHKVFKWIDSNSEFFYKPNFI